MEDHTVSQSQPVLASNGQTSAEPAAALTAGPWVAEMQFGEWFVRQDPSPWHGKGYQLVCSLPAASKKTQLGEMFAANARLIAAAPDLLAALYRLWIGTAVGTDAQRIEAMTAAGDLLARIGALDAQPKPLPQPTATEGEA